MELSYVASVQRHMSPKSVLSSVYISEFVCSLIGLCTVQFSVRFLFAGLTGPIHYNSDVEQEA